MKKLFGLLLLVSTLQLSAQTVNAVVENQSKYLKHTTSWGGEEKIGFADGSNIIQVEATAIKQPLVGYVSIVGHAIHALVIRKTDQDGTEIKVNKLEGGERAFGPMNTLAIEFHGKLLLFYYKHVNKVKMELFASELDRNSLELTNTRSLYSFPLTNTHTLIYGLRMFKDLQVKPSPDSSRLLLAASGLKDELFTWVLDQKGDVQFSKTIQVKGTDLSQLHDIAISNTGTIAVVYSKNYPALFNQTFHWAAKAAIVINENKQEKQIDLEKEAAGGELLSPALLIAKDGSKVFLGGDYYGPVRTEGIWLKEISCADLKVGKTNRIPYPEEYIKQVADLGFGYNKRDKRGINETKYQLIELDNGQLMLGGSPEEIYDSRSTFSNGHVIYFTGPIMMTFLDAKRKAVFTQIPRNNNNGPGAHSVFMPYGNKMVVIYTDYDKNITGPLKANDVHQKGGAVVRELSLAAAIVQTDGKIESRKLLAEGIGRMRFFNTSKAVIQNDKQVIVPASGSDRKEKELKVAVITID
ncbi:hypothetical protein ACFSQD_12755 [Flavihumibacter stibioxidans]|uniref:Uncharacterized protein n=1 Tax=Flavihumibacter stibioxidans TaxID=1834163 RepID=A0ABR7M930_9BACT|nr:hypothetical protein [Flavihumibacter stibioxidans]MBC6491538.1 hypothetical protein [Flavihumibacter stibioxidans]